MERSGGGPGSGSVVEVDVEGVLAATSACLVAHGVRHSDATTTAAGLVEGTRRGYLDHGVERMLDIIPALGSGALRGDPDRTVVFDRGGFLVIDGDSGLGPPAAQEAVDLASERARHHGVAAVGVRGAGHIGVLAPYVERAAATGCFALATTTTAPATVVAGGGGEALLGTNPIAYAFPSEEGRIVSADFSTSAVSRSVLLGHAARGEPLPPGVAVDSSGSASTDPEAALSGGLLPHGADVRGTLLGLLVAVLAGPLVGAPPNHKVVGTRDLSRPPHKGDLVLCLHIGDEADRARFGADVGALLGRMVASASDFHLPGSESARRRRGRTVPLSDATAALLEPWLR